MYTFHIYVYIFQIFSHICSIYIYFTYISYNFFIYFGLSLTAGSCYAERVSKGMRALKFAVCHDTGHKVEATFLQPAFGLLNRRGWLIACETFVSASN